MLLFDFHHIIADGISIGVLLEELSDLYQGKSLPALPLRYRDYAVWQSSLAGSDELDRQRRYWVDTFADGVPVLDLVTDRPRVATPGIEGGRCSFTIVGDLTRRLRGIAEQTGATTFMVLKAAFDVFLARHTLQDDVVVGVPTAGRTREGLDRIVGMFVNTLPLRTRPAPDRRFCEFLDEVKQGFLTAGDHQDFQFDALVEALGIRRTP